MDNSKKHIAAHSSQSGHFVMAQPRKNVASNSGLWLHWLMIAIAIFLFTFLLFYSMRVGAMR